MITSLAGESFSHGRKQQNSCRFMSNLWIAGSIFQKDVERLGSVNIGGDARPQGYVGQGINLRRRSAFRCLKRHQGSARLHSLPCANDPSDAKALLYVHVRTGLLACVVNEVPCCDVLPPSHPRPQRHTNRNTSQHTSSSNTHHHLDQPTARQGVAL